MNRGNFLHKCSNFFLFLRTTSEGPDILSYCPRTTANKLSHNSSSISERRGVIESYLLLHRYFHKVHNVTVDTVFHTWASYIILQMSIPKIGKPQSYMLEAILYSSIDTMSSHQVCPIYEFAFPIYLNVPNALQCALLITNILLIDLFNI
mgnify:CR=1 FL=1